MSGDVCLSPTESGHVGSGYYRVHLADGTSLTSTSVIIATGARYRRLDVPRLDYFEKMSVYYAASQAEALMCQGDPVANVGGGNSAGQAAVFLSAHATRIVLIVREHDLSEHMSRYLIDQVMRLPNIQVMVASEVRETARRPGAGGDHRRRQPCRHVARPSGARALRLHRGCTVHRLAGRPG
jgi:thioredoxin reductase